MSPAEMEAGPEMDALIAERVMEWTLVENQGAAGGRFWQGGDVAFGDMSEFYPPRFSTDIVAAWEVVEKLAGDEFGRVELTWDMREGGWVCSWGIRFGARAVALTAPLAICRAALAATEARYEREQGADRGR